MASKPTQENPGDLDFDTMSELAEHDLETFESMRLAAIEELIESAPQERQQRMRCLQWRIDQERRLARTPLGACYRISKMMWESLIGKDGLMDQIKYLSGSVESHESNSKPRFDAKVIPIRSE